jgi:pseudaminic acid cytidylyltransferase
MAGNMAIIPARGGSKRLPRKNILPFLGRPIISYTLEAARKSGLFDVIVVSTEDSEIAATVEGSGCDLHERPPELASDTARLVLVIREVLDNYDKRGQEFDFLCCLYPTAPLRDKEDIQRSYDLLLSRGADYCLAVTEYELSPFFAFDINEHHEMRRRWPELALLPSWQKPRVVVDNGSLYWARVSRFKELGELEGPNTVGYLMPRHKSIDIDTQEDFDMAEFFARKYGM